MINRDIIKILNVLNKRPSLLIVQSNFDYLTAKCYIQGFFNGIEISKNFNLERKVSKWYQDRVTVKAPNMNFFAQFDLIHKDIPDIEKRPLLFETLLEFFNHSEEFYIQFL